MSNLILFVGLLFLLGCLGEARGAHTKEEIVTRYLAALEHNNPAALLKLVPPNLDAEASIRTKLHQYGGQSFREVQIEYRPPIHPRFVNAVIRGVSGNSHQTGAPFREEIDLMESLGRWYLVLGQDHYANPPPSTLSPE